MPATLETQIEVLPPETREIGRPSLFDDRSPIILEAIRRGHTLSSAASFAGISRDTACAWARDFPAFSDSVNRAESDYCDTLLDKLLRCENKFGPDAKAITFALERRFRRDWGQVTTVETRNLSVSVTLSGDQLAALQGKWQRALEAKAK